jgi:hypothetical protein
MDAAEQQQLAASIAARRQQNLALAQAAQPHDTPAPGASGAMPASDLAIRSPTGGRAVAAQASGSPPVRATPSTTQESTVSRRRGCGWREHDGRRRRAQTATASSKHSDPAARAKRPPPPDGACGPHAWGLTDPARAQTPFRGLAPQTVPQVSARSPCIPHAVLGVTGCVGHCSDWCCLLRACRSCERAGRGKGT